MPATMRAPRLILLAVLAALLTTASLSAQATAGMKEERRGLLAQAKVTPDSARRLAQAKIPDGTITSAEIEREHGKLLYSFDITRPGKTGIDEVQVDARTGALVGVEHESPAAERREATAERRAKSAKPAAPVAPY